ncbi:hypothetical protein HO662_08530 [Streptococcus suis]|nr:hypothetical protein [Streptococcus suis]NQH32164.1 hypothetical protein [Streptococcus suis]NQP00327.1 hypothetical protein [Streptococcus suis]NQP48024.1 hypothetical protein [Streptococcus suis]NQP56116.1 hypothetical protein [Streptococcus suis]HEL9637874.1 hypothetical protein [Streptococcus suis]
MKKAEQTWWKGNFTHIRGIEMSQDRKRIPKFPARTSAFPQELYFMMVRTILASIDESNEGEGINFYNSSLFYIPVIAINLWEYLLNSAFQNDFVRSVTIFGEAQEALDKWDIKTKTLVYPKLLLGEGILSKDESLWQDFQLVLKIRNEIIHYKNSFYEGPAKEVAELRRRQLTVRKQGFFIMDWPMEIATTEFARLCVNTVVKLWERLHKLTEDSPFDTFYKPDVELILTEEWVKNEMRKKASL